MQIHKIVLLFVGLMSMVSCLDSGNSPSDTSDQPRVLDMENYQVLTWQDAQAAKTSEYVILKIAGEVRHFGMDFSAMPPRGLPYTAVVSGAQVWIGDYPCSKGMNVQTDSSGNWTLYVLKKVSTIKKVSFRYRKDFFSVQEEKALLGQELPDDWNVSLASSNRLQLGSENPDKIGFQFPDEIFLSYAVGLLENAVGTINNLLVVTVGQSWASLFSERLPHGMEAASAIIRPELETSPIYFNESVMPDPSLQETSKDGGVLFYNLPDGEYSVTAEKQGEEFDTVEFSIADDVRCYIASPPFSVEAK